jgi:hypothetical protein
MPTDALKAVHDVFAAFPDWSSALNDRSRSRAAEAARDRDWIELLEPVGLRESSEGRHALRLKI